LRENMLPVIEKFTGTEYSTAKFVITAILLLLITGFAGYITGKSAAESFGGNKKKTAVVFTVTAVLTMAALLCFFGASAKAARGGVMCIIMLYAAYEDIKTRECADFLSVMLGITERIDFILNCLCRDHFNTFNIFRRNQKRDRRRRCQICRRGIPCVRIL